MKYYHWLVGIVAIIAASCSSAADCGSIDEKVAQQLVRDALTVMKQNGPDVSVESFTYSYAPEFLAYQAMWIHPKGSPSGSSLIGYFAVNPWTGDVWEINACRKISSPAMKKIQDSIWKQSKLPPAAEAILHERTPGCTPDEVPDDAKPKAEKRRSAPGGGAGC